MMKYKSDFYVDTRGVQEVLQVDMLDWKTF